MVKKIKKSKKLTPRLPLILSTIVILIVGIGTISLAKNQQELNSYAATNTLTCSISGATGATATQTFTATNAIPNDATDDTTAIQSAITNASTAGGGVVNLAAGTYVINGHLLMKNNVKLQGVGPQTILKAGPNFLNTQGPNGGYPIISTNGASNVTIANLTADQSGDTLNGNVSTRLNEYLVDVRGSTNAIIDGVYTRNPFTYSIALVDSTKFCVKNSNTQVATSGKYDQLDGIHVLNSSFGDVINNTVDQGVGTDGDDGLVAHTIDGTVHDITYAGNNVRAGKNGSGMQLAFTAATDQIYNLKIQNNTFWGSPDGIITGVYGTDGKAHDITVGGSAATGNSFMNNAGNAVQFTGSLKNITVTYNTACSSGVFSVGSGTGNVVNNNTTASTCAVAVATPTPTGIQAPTNTPVPTVRPTSTPTPQASSTTIVISAAGTPAYGVYPTMSLVLNGQTVKTWTNVAGNPTTRSFQPSRSKIQ